MSGLARLVAVLGIGAVAFGGACSTKASSGKGSETSWLTGCVSDDDCKVGQCICGVCTAPCTADTDCPGGTDPGTCAASGSTAYSTLCGAPVVQPNGICVSGCGGGAPCAGGFTCTDGACLPETGTVTSGLSRVGPGASGFFEDWISAKGVVPMSVKCLPSPLGAAVDGSVPCVVMRVATSGCDCAAAGLKPLDPHLVPIAQRYVQRAGACGTDTTPPCESQCICEVQPFGYGTPERTTCLEDASVPIGPIGYCYVDPVKGLGNPAVVAKCPSNQMQVIRLGGQPDDKLHVMACLEPGSHLDQTGPGQGRLGAACVPAAERDPAFPGYQPTEVAVEHGSPDCATGVCLVNGFRGRVTCPYGQSVPPIDSTHECFTPDAAHEPVTVQVDPWIARAANDPAGRKPDRAVYCSCRCDGPDLREDYCACPTGFECMPLTDDIGKGGAGWLGSYCVKTGTMVTDPASLRSAPPCLPGQCGP